jgi:DinB family protein
MAQIDTLVEANRAAVNDLIAAARGREDVWMTPRAPGKWSPSQLVEHVARSLEESANEARGLRSKFPRLPFFLRPVARTLLFNRVLRSGVFPRARTSRPFDPVQGPASVADAQRRLDQAVGAFIEACRDCAAGNRQVRSTVFGVVAIGDYARFQECHTRHHTRQLGG